MTKLIMLTLTLLLPGPLMAIEQKIVYGYVERAILLDQKLHLLAKFDTGAKSASLSAIEIRKIEENGQYYLYFKVPYKAAIIQFKSPYIGKVKIKLRTGEIAKHNMQKEAVKRPVVMIDVQIGNKIRKIRVNLTNRKRFNYPLLLGRDAIIAFDGLVDPSCKYNIK